MSLEVEGEAATENADPGKRSASPAEWFLVNAQTGTALSLNREMVFVGRVKCDVVLESASIDNRHAVICFNPKDGCCYLRDLNTVHGSFVNEQKLPGPSYVKIQLNDKLRFGLCSQIFVVSHGPHIPKEKSHATADMPISVEVQKPEACDRNIFCTHEVGSDLRQDVRELAHVLPETCTTAASQQRIRNKMNQSSSSIFNPTPVQHPSCNKTPQTVTCESSSHKENGVIGSAKQDPDPDSKGSIFSVDAKDSAVPDIASLPKHHPAAFTILFDDDVNDDKKKSLAIGDSIRKFAPKKRFEKHRRNSKPPSTHSNQSPTETHEPRSLPIMSDTAPKSGPPAQLSDSAVFLIQRMFDSEQPTNKVSEDEDLKSEAGTYTLETECQNVDLERARKMIDNVFGVENYVEGHAACFAGSVPASPRSSRSNSCHKVRSILPKEIQRPQIPSLQDETRSRTFTRCKPRRGSLQEQVPAHSSDDDAAATFERSYSLRSKAGESPRRPLPNPNIGRERRDSFSSSKSGLSSKTIEVKNAAVINHVRKGSDKVVGESSGSHKRQIDAVSATRTEHFAESLSSGSAGNGAEQTGSVPSGLKLNRAFALRRARLGIETPGVPLTLTDEKQKKNQDNRNRQNSHADSSLSRSDGGRFSLRVSRTAGRPPLPSSHPSSPEKRSQDLRKQVQLNSSRSLRAASESNHTGLSPSSSSSSIPNQYVQRSSSFGPQSAARSAHRKPESSDRSVRAMTPMQMTRRMFSVRPHQQQQYCDSVRNKQQANVVPIKRSPEACVSSAMTTSLNEQMSDQHSLLSHQPVIQRRTLSSLDNLVVSAILQLSGKLRFGMREWLDQEKVKHAPGSETRLMIDEILPQVSNVGASLAETSASSDNLSKDLSTILKNLKKVEQSLEVISLLAALEPANLSNRVSLSVAKDSKASKANNS